MRLRWGGGGGALQKDLGSDLLILTELRIRISVKAGPDPAHWVLCMQGCGSGSGLDPDSIGSGDPDPDPGGQK